MSQRTEQRDGVVLATLMNLTAARTPLPVLTAYSAQRRDAPAGLGPDFLLVLPEVTRVEEHCRDLPPGSCRERARR